MCRKRSHFWIPPSTDNSHIIDRCFTENCLQLFLCWLQCWALKTLYRFVQIYRRRLQWIAMDCGGKHLNLKKTVTTGPGISSPPRTMSRWMEGGRRPQGPQGQPGTGRRNWHRIVINYAYCIHEYVTLCYICTKDRINLFIKYLHVMTCDVYVKRLFQCFSNLV